MSIRPQVWDGTRTLSDRRVLCLTRFDSEGMEMALAHEDVRAPTDWCFNVPHHVIVVHLAGELQRMESTFGKGPSSDVLPATGDVWVIPADSNYAALAQGDHVRFAEFKVPVRMGVRDELSADVGRRDQFLFQACARAAVLAARGDDAAMMSLESLMHTMRLHIADEYLGGIPIAKSSSDPNRRAFSARQRKLLIDFIDSQKHGPIKVEQLAAEVGLSMSHLLDGFKVSFGTTPWQYVIRRRLSGARGLLSASELSVTAISAATGFANPSHFATAFTRMFGVSPTTYRAHRRRESAD